MISCRRATELMSKAAEERLTIRERVSLWWHHHICEGCKHFAKQIQLCGKLLRQGRIVKEDRSCTEDRLSTEAKNAIKSRISKVD